MILGIDRHPQAECFREIDDAVRAMTDRNVVFNAHSFDAPLGSIVWNLENVPIQVPDPRERWGGHEVWDGFASNAKQYGAKYVAIGYHPSMQRFCRADTLDIDVVFAGCINERRAKVLQELADRGLNVVVLAPGVYGAERDAVFARARLAINMQYYESGNYPTLRAAHLVANKVPMLSERAPEMPA